MLQVKYLILAVLVVLVALPVVTVAGTLSGTIRSDEAGTPVIAGALIRTEGEPGYSATSASNGTYSITAPGNTYNILVSSSGHNPQRATLVITSASVTTQDFALRLAGTSSSSLALTAPLDWGEPPAAPTAPGDSFPVVFSDMASTPVAGAPKIAGWNETVKPDESFTLTGSAFTTRTGADAGSDTTVWIWARTSASAGILKQAKVWRLTENTITATVPSDVPYGAYIVWVENANGTSAPVFLNKPIANWLGPLGNTVQAGNKKRVFGRNISYGHGTSTSYVYIQPAAGGSYISCPASTVNPYMVEFTVPVGTTNGNYKAYVHSGHGGVYGWSDGLDLTVQNDWVRDTYEIDLTPSGTDDTAAIQNAINTVSARANGGIVRLSAGNFKTYEQIWVNAKSKLVGAGMNSTTIELRMTNAGRHDYVRVHGDHIAIQDLTLKAMLDSANPPVYGILEGPYPEYSWTEANDIKYTNMRLTGELGTTLFQNNLGWSQVEASGCEFNRAVDAGSLDGWDHDSTFYGGPYGIYSPSYGGETEAAYNVASRSVLENSHFETLNWPYDGTKAHPYNYMDNLAYDDYKYKVWAKRVALFGMRASHSYIGNLTTTNVAVQDNKGEMILLHGLGCQWFGNVLSTSGLTLNVRTDGLVNGQTVTLGNYGGTIAGGQPVPDGYPSWIPTDGGMAVVIAGTGIGQARQLVSHTTTSITVDRPWRVQPDSTSILVVAPEYVDHIVYNNDLNAFPAGYVQTTTASVGIDIDGNGYQVATEKNTSHRTCGGRMILSNSGGVTYWSVMRDEVAADVFQGGYGSFTWDTNPVGHVLLGNSFHNCSTNITDSMGVGAMRMFGEGAVCENFTSSTRVGYQFDGSAQSGSYPDGFTLFRNGSITAINGPAQPPNPIPAYFSTVDNRQYLNNNTYSGGSQNYWFAAGGATWAQPIALNRVARFKGYKDTRLPDVVIPIADAGVAGVTWSVTASNPWITAVVQSNGTLQAEQSTGELAVSVDTSTLGTGVTWGYVTLTGGGKTSRIGVKVDLTTSIPTTGLVAWYKSNAGVTTVSNAVSQWNDQSGGGRNVTQSTSSYRPLYVTNVINGYPVVRFQGTDDVLKTASGVRPFDGTTKFSTFGCYRHNASTLYNSYQRVWWEGSTSNINGYGLYINNATTPQIKASWGSTSSNALLTDPNTMTVGKWYAVSTIYNQTNHRMWVNGSYVGSAAKTNSNINTGVLNIGNYSTNNQGFNGDMTELIIYNRDVTDAERQQIEAYLSAKYFVLAASFTATPSSGLGPLTSNFDASASSTPAGTITSYAWSYGDGSTGTGVTSSHQFTLPGSYNVTLTVTSSLGNTDITRRTVTVSGPTALALSADKVSPVTAGTAVTLTATPTGGTNREYQFQVNNGSGWTVLRAWAGSNTCVWTPGVNGNFSHQAFAREVGSGAGCQTASNILSFSAYSGQVTWDVAADASTASNPNGAWSYGYTRGPDCATFTLFTTAGAWGANYQMLGWFNTRTAGQWDEPPMWAGKNAYGSIQYQVEPGKFGIRPVGTGAGESKAVARFTAPAAGYYTFTGQFKNNNGWHGNAYSVVQDNVNYLFDGNYTGQTDVNTIPLFGVISAAAGGTLDFVGRTNGDDGWETSQIDATIKMGQWAVRGYVEDANHVRLSGAKVEVVNGSQSIMTDTAGNYTLVVLNSGTYNIRASKPGYDSVTSSGVVIDGTAVVSRNFTLPLGVIISGTVTENLPGAAVLAGVQVATPDGSYSAVTNASGYYSMQVTRGIYSLGLYKYGYVPKTVSADASANDITANAALDQGWDFAADYTNTAGNPRGAWTYGYSTGSTYTQSLFSSMPYAGHWSCDSFDIDWHAIADPGYYGAAFWKLNRSTPLDASGTGYYGGPAYREPYKVMAMPSGKVASAVARFRAPSSGYYRITARFAGTKQTEWPVGNGYTHAKVGLLYQSNYIFGGPTNVKRIDGFAGRAVNNYTDSLGTSPVLTYTADVVLSAGDTLDAVVLNDIDHADLGGWGYTEGWVQLDLTVQNYAQYQKWDVTADYTTAANPNGRWSYGYTTGSDLNTFALFTTTGSWDNYFGMQGWYNTKGPGQWDAPPIWAAKNYCGVICSQVEPGKFGLRAAGSGSTENKGVARFSAPSAGYYSFTGQLKNTNGWHTNTYAVATDKTNYLYSGTYSGLTGSSIVPISGVVSLGTSGTIDFVAGTAWDDGWEASQLDATIRGGQWAVQGYVQDSGSNRLSGAKVEVVGGSQSVTTDSAGNYTLVILDSGSFNIRASKPGYEPVTTNGVVVDGTSIVARNFTLALGVTVSGTITSAISPYPAVSGAVVSTFDQAYSATTNSAGYYSMQVTRGSYSLTAYKYGYIPSTATANASSGNATQNYSLARGWDFASDFTSASNPSGVWTYGYASGTAYTQTAFSSMTVNGHWSLDSFDRLWYANLTTGPDQLMTDPGYYSPAFEKLVWATPIDASLTAYYGGPCYREPYKVNAMPSGKVRSAVARFATPANGTYLVTVRFAGEKQTQWPAGGGYTKAKVALMQNNSYIFGGPSNVKQIDGFVGRSVNNYTDSAGTGTPVYTYSTTVTLNSGDTIDAVVLNDIDHADQGYWGYTEGWVQLDLSVQVVSGGPGPVGPSRVSAQSVADLKNASVGSRVSMTTPAQLESATSGSGSFDKKFGGGSESSFFVQSDDRVQGIKCLTDGGLPSYGPDYKITFSGTVELDSAGQKVVRVTSIDSSEAGYSAQPIGKSGMDVTNTGTLVRIWGLVTQTVMNIGSDSKSYPVEYCVVGDGSRAITVPMHVTYDPMSDGLNIGDFVAVTGIATTTGSDVVVMPRNSLDIQVFTSEK